MTNKGQKLYTQNLQTSHDFKAQPPSKNKKYCVKFNDLWCNKYKFIQKFRIGEGFALCTLCGNDQFWCKLSDCKLRPKSSEN